MMIWIVFSVLAVVAALSVLVPLSRSARDQRESAAYDVEVYKAQLGEVDRDLDRGLISEEAAEAARTEIARRLIAAGAADSHDSATRQSGEEKRRGSRNGLRVAQALALIVVPLGAVGLYSVVGSPDLPDQPLRARLEAPATARSLPDLVARVEQRLAEEPSDGRGWDVIAPAYMRLGRAEDAAAAYAAAIRLLGSTVRRETDRGEALVIGNNGIVGADARAAFERAVALDKSAIKPRFFLALALTQENRTDKAIAAWQDLLDEAQGGEAWAEAVRVELSKLGVETEPAIAAPGPSQSDVAAAAQMNSADRSAMIRSMVDRLDTRLSEEGGSTDEWLRLMRAVAVLGDTDRLRDTATRAEQALKQDPAGVAQVKSLARELGVGS
ncbi:c-type cytochrome biogenesis protein CcmI [Stappia sp. ES.058]|uniref:c-type cytochrome biogenesis protein CcmI n=1 Tax=Stappia sp. ES.058 TaxID=1881061 RepID=UPI000B89DE83|nr:c-type cytochrome biogenesis protein CcmI [Stappia sp. ES.058]